MALRRVSKKGSFLMTFIARLIALFACLGPLALARAEPQTSRAKPKILSAKPYHPLLDEKVMREEIAFRDPAPWHFNSKADLENVLLNHLDADLRSKISGAVKSYDQLDAEERRLFSVQNPGADTRDSVFVLMTEELRLKIPPIHQGSSYWYFFRNRRQPPTLAFNDMANFEKFSNEFSLDARQKLALLQDVFVMPDGKPHLLLSATARRNLPPKAIELIEFRHEFWLRDGLKLTLTVTDKDDLFAVARQYVDEEQAAAVARYLRIKLNSVGKKRPFRTRTVSVPLEKLLQPFVRRTHGTFSMGSVHEKRAYEGPNCYNCGLSVNRGKNYEQVLTTPKELIASLHNDYRPVAPGQPLNAGDLLLYVSRKGDKPVHVVTYFGEAKIDPQDKDSFPVVYTKDGLHIDSPYLFAPKRAVERGYFPKNDFLLLVWRKERHANASRPKYLPGQAPWPPKVMLVYQDGLAPPCSNKKPSLMQTFRLMLSPKPPAEK